MSALLRKLEVARHQLGWTGLAGMLLIFISMLFGVVTVLPAQHELQQKKHELAWLSQQPSKPATAKLPVLDDAQALQKFYQQFPPVTEVSSILEQIHQLAQKKGIRLTVGEYKLSNDAVNPNVQRYEIIFPVEAHYRNLRDFITAASLQFPTLGLTEINIKRDYIGESAAQIKLNYVLLMVRKP